MSISQQFAALRHPIYYHGHPGKRGFFEGWYYKVVDASEQHAFAFIPGISFDANGQSHAFVQVLDGTGGVATYHRFAASEFQAGQAPFEVKLGDNFFSQTEVRLRLPDLHADLRMSGLVPWPSTWRSPGIMGWFSFVPFMECYHGIVSLNHQVDGLIEYKGRSMDFNGGKGYGEKDWGRSFPKAWIWMQSNHFQDPALSLTASVARIPWLGNSFVGFIAGLWWKGELLRFTTYTGARLDEVSIDGMDVRYVLHDRRYRLELTAHHGGGGELVAPISGAMEGRVNESMSSRIGLRLFDKGKLVLEEEGRRAALEVAGPPSALDIR